MNVPQTEARRWFRQAQADVEVVRTLLAAGHYAVACFQSQQAAEKALKAMLYSRGLRVVLGYSVRELAKDCAKYNVLFAGIAEEAALLDQFYIATRYPNGLPSPAIPSETYTADQAKIARQSAEHILSLVEILLREQMGILHE